MCNLQSIYDKLLEVYKVVIYSMYYIRKVEVRFKKYIYHSQVSSGFKFRNFVLHFSIDSKYILLNQADSPNDSVKSFDEALILNRL